MEVELNVSGRETRKVERARRGASALSREEVEREVAIYENLLLLDGVFLGVRLSLDKITT